MLVMIASLNLGAQTVEFEFHKSAESVDSEGRITKTHPNYIGVSLPQVIDVNLADLPRLDPWQPGDAVVSIPKRRGEPEIVDPQPARQEKRAVG